jgi:hypothetical protein
MPQTSFCDFVDYIAHALDLFDSVQGILILDCCPAHLSDQFLLAGGFRANCNNWMYYATFRCWCLQAAEKFFEKKSMPENG